MVRNSNSRDSIYVNNPIQEEEDEAVADRVSSKSESSTNMAKAAATIEGNSHSIMSSVVTQASYWILDTGATNHICSSVVWFTSYTRISPLQIRLPNGKMAIAHFSGTVKLTDSLTISNVLFLPQFTFNLISVAKLTSCLHCKLVFEANSCTIQDLNSLKIIGLAKEREGLYHLEVDFLVCRNQFLPDCTLWHLKLGHLSPNRMMMLNKKYEYIPVPSLAGCDICHFSCEKAQLTFSVSNSIIKAEREFELLHADIWGPYSTASAIHGFRYFLTILDDFSRFIWIVFLKSKSEVRGHIESFVQFVETNFFEKKINIICSSDKYGPEFQLHDFYASKGIIHHNTSSCVAQQNCHQHILNVSRALMYQSKLPKLYCSYAVLHSVYLINRIPTNTMLLGSKFPFEVLHGKFPDLSNLHVFGCCCYSSTLQGKLDPRASKCVFLGFLELAGTEGYILLDTATREILMSLDVFFYDSEFPFHNNTTAAPSTTTYTLPHIYLDSGSQLD